MDSREREKLGTKIEIYNLLKGIEPRIAEAFMMIMGSKNGQGTIVIRIRKRRITDVKYDIQL